jgi:hypothetical protein
VNADCEGGASAEEAAEEGVEGAEEILAKLGFGGGERDYGRLTVREDVDARELGGPFDDVEGQDKGVRKEKKYLGPYFFKPTLSSDPPYHVTSK